MSDSEASPQAEGIVAASGTKDDHVAHIVSMKVKIDRLAARKRELKTALQQAQEKEQAFVERMDRHMDEVDRSEARLEKECSELRHECAELTRRLEDQDELFDVTDKDRETRMGK